MTITMIRVELEILQSWGVGGVASLRDPVDLPIQMDPRGDGQLPYVPSTSLVGALRRHLAERAETWLGPQPGALEVSTGSITRTRSPLRALGSRVEGTATITEYGSTAIDPARRAAKEGSLRREQRVDVLEASSSAEARRTRLSWYLQHDGTPDGEFLKALASWQPVVGRRRSTGHGRARVTTVTAFPVDLSDEVGLTWWLEDRAAWLSGTGTTPAGVTVTSLRGEELRLPAWSLALRWAVVEPVHVGGIGTQGENPSGEVRPSARKHRTAVGTPIIPGSSWKGIFRHRVEHILTLCGVTAGDLALVQEALFGVGGTSRADVTGRRGCLAFPDSALTAPDGRAAARVERTHVAIDRVSGGAHEGLLFAVDAVEEGSLADSRMESTLDLPAEVANLLNHVVRDIHDGFVGVGGGTTRGYGRLKLADGTAPDVRPVDSAAIVTWAKGVLAPKEVYTA